MRITLRVLCEGYSEQNFVSQVLAPHLRQFQVYARAELLARGRFGIVSYGKLRKAIQLDVGRSRPHEYVTTMIDLYKIGRYPDAISRPNETAVDRVTRIEDGMADGLPNPRFIPYVQLHEFEALVLVDVSKIPDQFPEGGGEKAVDELRQWIGDTPPELVNDGAVSAPSQRIIKVLPEYARRKAEAGPLIAAAIGLERLRTACPHFDEWVTKLEGLSEHR